VTEAINEWKFGAEVVMVLDKWYFQSEYLMAHVNRRASVENYNGDGWYAQVGYALLNGRYGYNKTSGMATAPGAKSLEILCRYNLYHAKRLLPVHWCMFIQTHQTVTHLRRHVFIKIIDTTYRKIMRLESKI